MTDRIVPLSSSPHAGPEAPATHAAEDPTFRSLLRDGATSIAHGEAAMQAAVARLHRHGTLAPEELIALQATVYRHAVEVDLAAKLVDKLTAAVRTTLSSQQ